MSEQLSSFEAKQDQDLSIQTTEIPGLLVVNKKVRHDARGWFMEAWQREEMLRAGLPDLGPVQMNISHNDVRGTLRGIHTEPWDKYVGIINGKAFVAFVDLREGPSFSKTHYQEIDPSVSVFVPRGVGNSYLTLTDNLDYAYLVNAHWRPGVAYPALRYNDPTVSIPWPLPEHELLPSDKDRSTPFLNDVEPIKPRKSLILGAGGQLGIALGQVIENVDAFTRAELDITDAARLEALDWNAYDNIVNAAAYTKVDLAETPEGSREAWRINADAVSAMAQAAAAHGKTFVHYSSDYVFDGLEPLYTEDAIPHPLSVYGMSKAAGDIAAQAVTRRYIVRSSWVVGEGNNFVRTMVKRAVQGLPTSVVHDQFGRLTFAEDMARATHHLLNELPEYGTYNVTGEGERTTWFIIAKRVFELVGADTSLVTPVTTQEYFAGKTSIAPRPTHSTLDTAKIRATGFTAPDWQDSLIAYVDKELTNT